MGKSERPEHTAPPDIYYNAEEARKYTTNSRIMQIQVRLGSNLGLARTFAATLEADHTYLYAHGPAPIMCAC